MAIQLDFFRESGSEIELMHEEVTKVKNSTDKMRKSLFAKHGELAKKYADLENRLNILERNICSGSINNL